MAYSENQKNKIGNVALQDIFPCKCCSLSTNGIQKGHPVEKGITSMKNLKSEGTLNAIEKRNVNLINRRQHLSNKISTMEKTLPMLTAYNIWKSGSKDMRTIVDKIQDLVNELSPNPRSDPVEKVIEDTKSRVGTLNTETTELHDKIIEADMKLEESSMILESLQVVNNELDEKLKSIEGHSTQGISPTEFQLLDHDDLNCLSKLRQLIQQEICLKSCIKSLEDRENRIHIQLNRILSTSEHKKNNVDIANEKINHEYCECCKCDEDDPIANVT